MTLLARLQTLLIAKEGTYGTYQTPVRSIPCTAPKPEDVITELRDESIRGNDDVLQGIYGGSSYSTFDYSLPHLYPDVAGDCFRAILGPDTYTAGIVTTLSASTSVGASSISVALSIPVGSTIMIDTGANVEYATTGTPTGSGPYTIPLTATGSGTTLALAHTSGVAVQSAAKHIFAQDQRANPVPGYSLTQYNAIDTRGYVGSVLSDLSVKIDPKGAISADTKWTGFPSATESAATAAFSTAQPLLGWQWTLSLNGVASTRGLSAQYDYKRAVEPIASSDGTQTPREVFPGALEMDFQMKAIFENSTDQSLFTNYSAIAILNTLTQPLRYGGATVKISSTGAKYVKFTPDFSGIYLMADINGSAYNNTTDNGLSTVTITNFVNSQY